MSKVLLLTLSLLIIISCSKKDEQTSLTGSDGSPISGPSDYLAMANLESEVNCQNGTFSTQVQPSTWDRFNQNSWDQYNQYPSTWNVPNQYSNISGNRIRFAIRSHFDQSGNVTRRESINPSSLTNSQVSPYYGRTQEGDLVLFRKLAGQAYTETVVSLCNRNLGQGNINTQNASSFSITSGRLPATVFEPNQSPNNCNVGVINSAEVVVNTGSTSLPIYPAPVNLQQFGQATSLCRSYFGQN